MKQNKSKETWVKPRHAIIRNVACFLLSPYAKWKFDIKINKFSNPENRQFLIIMNHQTSFDQFFVGMSIPGPIYYIATEDIFSLGWLSSLLRYAVAPIPIKKQTTDLQAVKNCVRVVKEGGTIALAPEGNRTYNGKTVYIKPSIVKLIKILKLPLAIFRIEGGYGVQPRWSDVVRKGGMTAGVYRVIEPEEYLALSDDELYQLVQKELHVDESNDQKLYYSKKNAEYLERVIYVCPHCGLSTFFSRGDILECTKCHLQVRYLPNKQFQGIGFDHPFASIAEWYDYQCNFVNQLDWTQYTDAPMYQETAQLSEVLLYKHKVLLNKNASITLYGDRILINDLLIPFEEAGTVTVLGKNKLNIYFKDKVYQLKGAKSFNALKYMNLYHHYKNIRKGDSNEQFLGL